jgi:CRISPR/Cas system CSM-associated protein Csm3 (group 7 of RAMP superfamily)
MQTWEESREIGTRLVMTGELVLLTPTHLGNGDADGLTDMSLVRDAATDRPLLTGTSIAGALRNYLRVRERGFFQSEPAHGGMAAQLFGGTRADPEGDQSWLIVDDAIADEIAVEIRDGVRIDPRTRTAQELKKYDLELLPAGTVFPLRFELLLPDDETQAESLCAALALALLGLEQGEIPLGARTSRGFGQCRVATWTVTTYAVTTTPGFLAWIAEEHPDWGYAHPEPRTGTVAEVLDVQRPTIDRRETFTINARFALDSAILIRSDTPLPDSDVQPDTIHLHTQRASGAQPVLPGTSLAGALRARAGRIVNTLHAGKTRAILDDLFGRDMDSPQSDQTPSASRLRVTESEITGGHILVQNRVAIDRFTGGAFDTALFNEAPLFGGEVELCLTMRDPRPHEIGLLLLLLKDLWTSDLPLGGTSSIGRGRLRGRSATIQRNGTDAWWLADPGHGQITITGDADALEAYVTAFVSHLEQS